MGGGFSLLSAYPPYRCMGTEKLSHSLFCCIIVYYARKYYTCTYDIVLYFHDDVRICHMDMQVINVFRFFDASIVRFRCMFQNTLGIDFSRDICMSS